MLEAPLLRARVSRTTIHPILVPVDDENLALCREITGAYAASVGSKRKALDGRLDAIEKKHDYKLVRGIAELLDRRSVYEPESSAVPPEAAREAVFSASGGIAATEEARKAALAAAAASLGISVEDVEKSMYADLDDELVLKETIPIPEEELLKRYNAELVETLLMRATKLRFSLSDGWQPVFRRIKRYGLMYEISSMGKQTVVEVQGPAQLFKLMDRYGSDMAKLLPEILKAKEWSISADILSRDKRRVLAFGMVASDLLHASAPDEPYDSSVEERFAKNFHALNSNWTMKRETEVVAAGQWAFIPDFVFELGNRKVYFEIAGFWTKEYIERKIAKLKLLPPEMDLIVAANEDLACSGIAEATKNLFFYSGSKVQVKPVLDHLAALERQVSEEQSKLLSLAPSGDVFDLAEFAAKSGILLSAVEKQAEKGFPGYARAGDCFIRAEKMDRLRALLAGVKDYGKAVDLLAAEGITKPDPVIAALHYAVEWKDLTTAELVQAP